MSGRRRIDSTQPVTADDPITRLDNVVLCPHAVCDTYELRRDVLATTVDDLLAIADRRLPHAMVNPGVVDTPRFRAKRDALVARMRRPG